MVSTVCGMCTDEHAHNVLNRTPLQWCGLGQSFSIDCAIGVDLASSSDLLLKPQQTESLLSGAGPCGGSLECGVSVLPAIRATRSRSHAVHGNWIGGTIELPQIISATD